MYVFVKQDMFVVDLGLTDLFCPSNVVKCDICCDNVCRSVCVSQILI